MGWKFFDATGRIIEWPCPRVWRDIVRIEKSADAEWPPIRIACDVDNPLLGERGAARVYAGQKGLAMIDTDELEALTGELARRCCASAQVDFELITRPGMGAAGGIAVGLGSMLGAQLVPGSSLVSDWLSIRPRIDAADIVITGEGCFDRSSLEGKGPGAVLRSARQLGKSVHVFAGASKVSVKEGVALHVITPAGQPLGDALTECAKNLQHSVARVFADLRAASD
jgi:glycerate kinase